MQRKPITNPATVKSLIEGHGQWYHQMELAPGIVTPGVHPSGKVLKQLDALGLPCEASGMRVLDAGCSDGFFSFEMERRGAEVVGIDYAEPDATGFSIAARILDSRVTHRVRNVYNLTPEEDGLFDIVLFLGVLYHLRNPMLALDRIRSVTRPSALLFVRTQLATSWRVRTLKTPVWQFCPRDSLSGDGSNKWAPNLTGLKLALEECQFEVLDSSVHRTRGCVKAQAVSDASLEYHRKLDASEGLWGKPPG